MPRPGVLGIRQLDFTIPIPSWDIIANETGSLLRSADWQTAWFEWRGVGGGRPKGGHLPENFQRPVEAPPPTLHNFGGGALPPRRAPWCRPGLPEFLRP